AKSKFLHPAASPYFRKNMYGRLPSIHKLYASLASPNIFSKIKTPLFSNKKSKRLFDSSFRPISLRASEAMYRIRSSRDIVGFLRVWEACSFKAKIGPSGTSKSFVK